MEMQEDFVRECIWTIDGHSSIFFGLLHHIHFLCHLLCTTDMHLVVRTWKLPIFTCSLFFS
jgi:hypothetical protein